MNDRIRSLVAILIALIFSFVALIFSAITLFQSGFAYIGAPVRGETLSIIQTFIQSTTSKWIIVISIIPLLFSLLSYLLIGSIKNKFWGNRIALFVWFLGILGLLYAFIYKFYYVIIIEHGTITL